MNTIKINNIYDYIKGKEKILTKGNKYEVNNTKYTEFLPCFVEVNYDIIEVLASHILFIRSNNTIQYHDFKNKLNGVLHDKCDFLDIEGSDYKADHYVGDIKAFNEYIKDKKENKYTRRQFIYQLSKRSCMNEIQFFEEEKTVILNFRSCDYIKKFIFDLLLMKILLDEYKIKCDRICCFIGSLHIYDGD